MILMKRILRSIITFFKRNRFVDQMVKSLVFTALLMILLGGLMYFQISLFIQPCKFNKQTEEENILFQSLDFTLVDRQLLFEAKEVQGGKAKLSKSLKQVEKCINNMEVFFHGHAPPNKK
ncbi:hypothetical protein [Enterococcus sp. AZ192]|uniref:hypothetical protein n=1 Tax=unclassified Enterococcus TaxID=2608891 RepID=UPI003D26F047